MLMTGITVPIAPSRPTSETPTLETLSTISVEAKNITVVSALPARTVPTRSTTLGSGPSRLFPSPSQGTQASAQARLSSIPLDQSPGNSSEEGMLCMGMKA